MSKSEQKEYLNAKHLALQIAAQLPENEAEAIRVLEYARRIYLQPLEEVAPTLRVVRIND